MSVDEVGIPSLRLTRSIGLIAASRSWPLAADPSSSAWLGDAPHLQALREPGIRLDLRPRHILQQDRPLTRAARLRRASRGIAAALLVNGAAFAGLFYLMSFRDPETPRFVEIPVEVVPEAPKSPGTGAEGPKGAETSKTGAAGPKGADASKSQEADKLHQALAAPVAADPQPPAPAQTPPAPAALSPPPPSERVQPPPAASVKTPTPAKAPPSAEGSPDAPKFVAPPPEPARAAAEERQTKPANAAPVGDKEDAALREAKPSEVPQVLATTDARADFAVPVAAPPLPKPAEKPAPPIPAKEPSATQKLAALLPMGALAMPASFRSALAGSGTQANAAYKGAVFGQFNRHPEIGERARQQNLKGSVVIAFTIGDDGAIQEIGVAQSSGDPRLDALGVELVRAAAPFPPPPPDAQRSFTPALAFGE